MIEAIRLKQKQWAQEKDKGNKFPLQSQTKSIAFSIVQKVNIRELGPYLLHLEIDI